MLYLDAHVDVVYCDICSEVCCVALFTFITPGQLWTRQNETSPVEKTKIQLLNEHLDRQPSCTPKTLLWSLRSPFVRGDEFFVSD
jgi:hypothetical protein